MNPPVSSNEVLKALKGVGRTSAENGALKNEVFLNLSNKFDQSLAEMIANINPIPANTNHIDLNITNLFIMQDANSLFATVSGVCTGGSFEYRFEKDIELFSLENIELMLPTDNGVFVYGVPFARVQTGEDSLLSCYDYDCLYLYYKKDEFVEYFQLSAVIGDQKMSFDLADILDTVNPNE